MIDADREPYPTFYNDESVRNLVSSWVSRHPEEVSGSTHSYLLTHAGRLAYTAELLRRVGRVDRFLDIGGTRLTEEIIGERIEVGEYCLTPEIDLEIDHWADMVGDGVDLALCAEVIEHMNADPAFLLQQANQALRLGGILVVTTVNIASMLGIQRMFGGETPYAMGSVFGTRGDRHHREYSSRELLRLVAAQGFEAAVTTVDLYESLEVRRDADRWVVDAVSSIDTELHGDTVIVVGRKVHEVTTPRRLSPVYHHSVADDGHDTLPVDVAALCRDRIDDIIESLRDPLPVVRPTAQGVTVPRELECPCCGVSIDAWRDGPNGRPNAACPACFSLERHRLLALVLEGLTPFVSTSRHVLEYAPQPQIRTLLRRAAGESAYVGVDLLDDRWIDSFVDACEMPFDAGSFDLIICFHVLEHIPDDASAIAEMARVLAPGGLLIVQVPSRSGPTDEDPSASIEERVRRFGQEDHIRYYGDDFIERLRQGGLEVTMVLGQDLVSDVEKRVRFGVLDHDPIWLCRKRR